MVCGAPPDVPGAGVAGKEDTAVGMTAVLAGREISCVVTSGVAAGVVDGPNVGMLGVAVNEGKVAVGCAVDVAVLIAVAVDVAVGVDDGFSFVGYFFGVGVGVGGCSVHFPFCRFSCVSG